MNSVVALGLAVAVLSPLPADRPDCLSLEGEPLRISTVQGAGPMAHTTSLSIRNGCDAAATVRLRLSPSDGNPSGASAIRTEFRAAGVTLLSAPWEEASDLSAAILVPSGVLDLTVRTTVGSGEAPPAPGVHIADFEADWVMAGGLTDSHPRSTPRTRPHRPGGDEAQPLHQSRRPDGAGRSHAGQTLAVLLGGSACLIVPYLGLAARETLAEKADRIAHAIENDELNTIEISALWRNYAHGSPNGCLTRLFEQNIDALVFKAHLHTSFPCASADQQADAWRDLADGIRRGMRRTT
ncbi:hypothetical protein [Microbacterium resistens]